MSEKLFIRKADGTTEIFKEEKLRNSLKNAGAHEKHIEEVLSHVRAEIGTDVTSDDIFRHAFHVLKQMGGGYAAKYSLRRSISQLGPSGFPFENFMSRVLEEQGYNSKTNIIVNGKCAEHEIDIISESASKVIFIESKFHNNQSIKSDMKVALYVQARHDDLVKNNFDNYGDDGRVCEFWLMTNTKFTVNSIKYAECAGLKMIGWSYPKEGNLQQLVEDSGLQPITCLTTLSDEEKRFLLNKDIVLCKTVKERPELLEMAGLDSLRSKHSLDEIHALNVENTLLHKEK